MAITSDIEFLIQWHLTETCNLRCRHCYQTGTKSGDLGTRDLYAAIDEVADTLKRWSDSYDIAFSPSINVTGGEPFLLRDLFEIIEYMRKKGFEIFILSNGILADKEKGIRLAEIGVRGVQVSIEGPEDVHDSIRGKGSFRASLKGVDWLLHAGLEITLNTTLSGINAERFLDMRDLAVSAGVHRLGYSRLVPAGKGMQLLHEMLPSEKVKELYEAIRGISSDGLEMVTGDPVAAQMSAVYESEDEDDHDSTPLGGCAAGVSGITVLPDGTLVPCRRLPVPVGNILRDSFREVWATSPVLCKLRDKRSYTGKCGTCKRWTSCRGCRAIAYSFSLSRGVSDYLVEDPQCFIDS